MQHHAIAPWPKALGMADDSQAPVDGIMDGHKYVLLAEQV